MAGRLFAKCVRSGTLQMQIARMSSNGGQVVHTGAMPDYAGRIGNREVVGYGVNGTPSYYDHAGWPMPAIRFKEITPDLQVLKEKEKGDWKKLSIEEKKTLYRASFRQTFAEMDAPTGEWKSITGCTLLIVSLAVWILILLKKFVYSPLPDSFKEENQLAQLERMRILDVNPITGLNRRN